MNFSKYLDLYRRNASSTRKACLQKPFPNGEHRIQKCYNKRIILKINKSKHVQINLLLYLAFNLFFPNVPILYPLKTSFSRDIKWEHGKIEMELNNTPFP